MPGSRIHTRSVLAMCAAAVVLAGSVAACDGGSGDAGDTGPAYAPVDAGLCDEIVPLLGDVQATLGVTLDDDVIATDPGQAAECYFRLNSAPPYLSTHGILWVAVETGSGPEVGTSFQDQQELTPESGQAYEPGSGVVAPGIGEEAVAFGQSQLVYDEAWSEYRIVSRDRNLVLRVDLFAADEGQIVPRQTMAGLVEPLAAAILALLPWL